MLRDRQIEAGECSVLRPSVWVPSQSIPQNAALAVVRSLCTVVSIGSLGSWNHLDLDSHHVRSSYGSTVDS